MPGITEQALCVVCISDLPVHSWFAAPGFGGIENIVVDKRTGLDEFEGGRGADHSIVVFACAGACG